MLFTSNSISSIPFTINALCLGLASWILPLALIGQPKVEIGAYDFTVTKQIPTASVEDQGSSNTCWSFSTSSFLESELLRLGRKHPDFSEMYFVRLTYLDKADKYLRYHGSNQFGEGGLAHDVFHVLTQSGSMPESAYTGLKEGARRHSHANLIRELKSYLDGLVKGGQIPANWKDQFNSILDQHLGTLPATFLYEGETYSPVTFARQFSPLDQEEYLHITSFQHHPFWSKCTLEVPDNFARQSYINIPIDTLTMIVRHAISSDFSVVWDCDISAPGFVASKGLAVAEPELETQSIRHVLSGPAPQKPASNALRQQAFDSYQLTDDHLMHIVGMAQDQHGDNYFLVKNSWGTSSGWQGMIFTSLPYFEHHTIAVTIHRDALPEHLSKKLQDDGLLTVNE